MDKDTVCVLYGKEKLLFYKFRAIFKKNLSNNKYLTYFAIQS